MNFTIPHNIFISAIFFVTICISNFNGVAQKYEIVYAQLHQNILDTSVYEIPPFTPKFDTLAKWVITYSNGESMMKLSKDSPAEHKTYYVNKNTGNFDSHTSYNMSKDNVEYNDYKNGITKRIYYFFDLKYTIEDKLPEYDWQLYDATKMIGDYSCRRATTKDPIDGLSYEVWYTEAIPLISGPLGLHGLPGLILKVNRNGVPFYTLLSIEKLDDNAEVILEIPETNEESISLSDYHKIRLGVPFVNKNTKPPNFKNKDQNR